MKIIKHSDIASLHIPPVQYMKWVKEALVKQYESVLPAKISVSLPNDGFFNTMPCYLPYENVMGVKVVNRYLQNDPALDATLLLYNSATGEQKAIMDATLITTMLTGAVAATSILKLKKSIKITTFAIMGLGVTARAALLCLLDAAPEQQFEVKLLQYKNQAELFIQRFANYSNVNFTIVSNHKDLIENSDVILSCISSANRIYGEDAWFKEGVLLVPVHTRGFQNCDLFFDKVFGDHTEQISHFKYFDKFKSFNEFAKVMKGEVAGRENNTERILVYNIGIALHDIYIANKIYDLCLALNASSEFNFKEPLEKFYV